jgi:hypothetical protein
MVLKATFEDIYGVSEEEHASESYLDMIRGMTMAQRWERVSELSAKWKKKVWADIRQRHPDYLDCQVMMAWLRFIMTDEEWKTNFGDLRIEV